MTQERGAKKVKVSVPTKCHLWNDKELTRDALTAALTLVKTYEDESHLIRTLLRCKECGQLFFHEFYEIVDWEHGNDAQYSTWIPVDDVESADGLNALLPIELLGYRRIKVDFPSDAEKPTAPFWTMR